jgi:hypothetical protein
MSKSSILAETLAEIQEIREGIEKNANHVLKSTLKDDLEAIVRKGLNEAEEDIQPDDMVGDGNPTDQGGEIASSEEITEPQPDMEPMGDEPSGVEVIDLTNEPFDKVSDEFERMQLTDEIEIVKTPEGGIQINIEPEGGVGGAEEMPADATEMGGEEMPAADETGLEVGAEEMPGENPDSIEGDEDETMKENEVVYEIEIAEDATVTETEEVKEESTEEVKETVEEVKDVTETEEVKEESTEEVKEDVKHVTAKAHMKHNTEELHESLVATRKKLQALVAENKNKTQELEKVNTLVEEFKNAETEYKSAIKNLKGQLQEVALFTSNLTYAVKLMTENSTTKDEKLDILKRFDSAKTLTESREVFSSLESLFKSNKSTVEKTIEERVLETPKSSGSTNLNESTAYKNPQLERMLDIIGKIK